jgi:hypothetical protein
VTPAPEEVVDDGAAAALEHEGNLVLHGQEHSAQADREDPVPQLLVDVGQGGVGLFHAGVVEGHVEASEGMHGGVEGCLDRVAGGDIADHGERPAAGGLDQSRGLLDRVLLDVGDRHGGAFTSERHGGGAADAAAGAGDEGDLVGEACGGAVLLARIGGCSGCVGAHGNAFLGRGSGAPWRVTAGGGP